MILAAKAVHQKKEERNQKVESTVYDSHDNIRWLVGQRFETNKKFKNAVFNWYKEKNSKRTEKEAGAALGKNLTAIICKSKIGLYITQCANKTFFV